MNQHYSHQQLIRFAGLFTWFCVAIPLIVMPFYYGPRLDVMGYGIWWCAQLAFGAAYWTLVRRHAPPPFGRNTVIALSVMSLAALLVSHYSQSGLGGILVLVIAGLLPWICPTRFGAIWLVVLNLALALVFALFPNGSLPQALLYCGLYLGFSSFTFFISLIARREALARQELRKLNSELRATQELLAESSRVTERVRIARELHDVVGHHLTALSLNLEVAGHLATGEARMHVERAHALAKLLLVDVREVVGQMRDGDELDLSVAINALIEDVPRPKIVLELPDHLTVKDPKRAQVLLRCVQEMITNAVRHADAESLRISLEETADGLRLHVADDGRGAERVVPGHGLTGMSERITQLGGRLRYESQRGRGFRLEAWLPLERAA